MPKAPQRKQAAAALSCFKEIIIFPLNMANLTFTGPCIVIYSYNKNQQDALLLRFI